jgi:hypothetical protein
MATFLFNYRLPHDFTPGTSDSMAAWEAWDAWFTEMGAVVVDRGNPIFTTTTLGECGTGPKLGGYSLVIAENLDAAAALANGCPLLHQGGGVEIGEITVLDQATGSAGA